MECEPSWNLYATVEQEILNLIVERKKKLHNDIIFSTFFRFAVEKFNTLVNDGVLLYLRAS
jgi:hypothetical protein